jgi:hypothetical protein
MTMVMMGQRHSSTSAQSWYVLVLVCKVLDYGDAVGLRKEYEHPIPMGCLALETWLAAESYNVWLTAWFFSVCMYRHAIHIHSQMVV